MKRSVVYTLLVAVIFSTLEPVGKVAAAGVGPYMITFIRFLIGGLLLLPIAVRRIRSEKLRITAKDLAVLTALGTFLICGSMIVLQVAVGLSSSPSVIAIIFCSNSLFTILIAAALSRKMPRGPQIAAMLLCAAGVGLCADVTAGGELRPVVLAVFSAASFSFYTILSKRCMSSLPNVVQLSLSFLLGSLVLLCFLLAGGGEMNIRIDGSVLLSLAYLGIVVTGLGYWFYARVLELYGPSMAATAFFIKPVISPVVAWAVNGIPLTWRVYAAAVLVLAGSYLNMRAGKATSEVPEGPGGPPR